MGPAAVEQSRQVNGRRRRLKKELAADAESIIMLRCFPSTASKREAQP